jgi:hypothetical protein
VHLLEFALLDMRAATGAGPSGPLKLAKRFSASATTAR